jgi:hypothetical protein
MANLDQFKTVIGEAFKIEELEDKIKFTVRSYISNAYINCTLWRNSHDHWVGELENGDAVIVNGKYTTPPKKDGDGHWHNLSVKRIGKVPMDAGVDDRETATVSASSDDEPDVL